MKGRCIMDTSAIIVSAGNSSRMNGTDKQFSEIDGIPVIVHSMLAFEKCKSILEIIVSTKKENMDIIKELAKKYNMEGEFNLKKEVSKYEPFYEIMNIASKFYQNNLNSTIGKSAKRYLLNRKIDELSGDLGRGFPIREWEWEYLQKQLMQHNTIFESHKMIKIHLFPYHI